MKAREIVAWVGFALAAAAAAAFANGARIHLAHVLRLEAELRDQGALCSGLSDEEREIVKNLRAAKAAQAERDNAERWRAPATP